MSKIVTTLVAAAALACAVLTAPPATAAAPVPYRWSPQVVKAKPVAKPCPKGWICISPIEWPKTPPRPYRP